MLFIATKNKLDEISFDPHYRDFYVEKLTEENLNVADKFNNPNIYFVGTSRGCSCDFGIEQNTIYQEEINNENRNAETGFFAEIRKIFGTQKKYIQNKIAKQAKLIEEEKKYLKQTETLFEIIERETTTENNTEMFYCWAGEYAEEIDETQFINLDNIKLSKVFDEINGNDKIIFTRGSR